MTLGMLVWSVLCVGFALVSAAALDDKPTGERVGAGFGLGCVVWAVGVGLWMLAGVVV